MFIAVHPSWRLFLESPPSLIVAWIGVFEHLRNVLRCLRRNDDAQQSLVFAGKSHNRTGATMLLYMMLCEAIVTEKSIGFQWQGLPRLVFPREMDTKERVTSLETCTTATIRIMNAGLQQIRRQVFVQRQKINEMLAHILIGMPGMSIRRCNYRPHN